MEFSLSQIAQLLNGQIEGSAEACVTKLCKIEEGVLGGLSFLANPQYTPYIYDTDATAVIVNADLVLERPVKTTLIRVENAYQAFAKLLEIYDQIKRNKVGISAKSSIHDSAKMGDNCYVGDFTVIGENVEIGENVKIYPQVYIGDNTQIGDNTIIYPGVKIYSDAVIGCDVIIHAGSVIGADGFGFAPSDASYSKVAQIGNVIIEDHVEIGANTCIDRATLGSTIIHKGVKLDNLIQIAHNVVVGENTVMASQTGISGSTKVGKHCMFGGQVGIAGHAVIADGVKLAAQSGVPSSLKQENGVFFGSPALDAAEYRRSAIHFKNFDKIVKRLNDLEAKLNEKK
ncbi:MAG: UDP-3-O-(3-hydroxymyristoyl)glucosamine N-acyltransferase [Bacteroidales bacterium]|jgi:UDP-3-O-[3-hydroxymyristoyl] glucosamine N-acyltransferase|nr:UDP-3-O-(3-hydroxymyristoyl)glucosamine N-acyltransferase [Bacteroidales bacterium]